MSVFGRFDPLASLVLLFIVGGCNIRVLDLPDVAIAASSAFERSDCRRGTSNAGCGSLMSDAVPKASHGRTPCPRRLEDEITLQSGARHRRTAVSGRPRPAFLASIGWVCWEIQSHSVNDRDIPDRSCCRRRLTRSRVLGAWRSCSWVVPRPDLQDDSTALRVADRITVSSLVRARARARQRSERADEVDVDPGIERT